MKLVTELSGLVREYLESRPQASIQDLAARSGLSYNTINRIFKAEANPSYESALCLVRSLGATQSEMIEFSKRHFPEITIHTHNSPASMADPISPKKKPKLAQAPLDSEVASGQELSRHDRLERAFMSVSDNLPGFLALNLASRAGLGVTKKELDNLMGGTLAQMAINHLKELGDLVTEKRGRFQVGEWFISRPYRIIFSKVKRAIEHLEYTHSMQKGRQYLAIQSEGYSEEGLQKLRALLEKTNDAIGKIRSDPANHGPHLGLAVCLLTTQNMPKRPGKRSVKTGKQGS